MICSTKQCKVGIEGKRDGIANTRTHTHSTACLGENETIMHTYTHSLALVLFPAQTLLASYSQLAALETLRPSTISW